MSKKRQKPFRPADKVSRLTFTEEERADIALEKPLKKAEKAADKLEKSHEKIPIKKTLVTERTLMPASAKMRCVYILKKPINQNHPQSLPMASSQSLKKSCLLKSIKKSEKASRIT